MLNSDTTIKHSDWKDVSVVDLWWDRLDDLTVSIIIDMATYDTLVTKHEVNYGTSVKVLLYELFHKSIR